MSYFPDRARTAEQNHRIVFGRIEVHLESGELRIDGRPINMEPQPRKLLLHLIRHRHRVVPKQELVEKVFGAPRISKAALARAIMKARQALGDAQAGAMLTTVPRVGYRFVAEGAARELQQEGQRESISVAFLPFDHPTEDATVAWVESGLPALIGEVLETDPRITLVTMPSVLGVIRRDHHDPLPDRVARLQRATGAAAVVHARVARTHGGLRADFRLFRGPRVVTGSVVESLPAGLTTGLAKALGRLLGCSSETAAGAAALPQDALASEAYFRGRQASADQHHDAALNLFRLAHELEPGHTAIGLGLLRQLTRLPDASAEIRSLAATLIGDAESANDRATQVRVHHALASWHVRRHASEEAQQSLDRVMELADGTEGTMFWSEVHILRALVAHSHGLYDAARDCLAHSQRLCRDAGDRARLLWLMAYESGLLSPREGAALAMEAAGGARQLGLPSTLAAACNNACVNLIELGRLAEAVAYGAEGFAAAASVGDRVMADHLAECSVFACRLAGWPSVAARALADVDALAGATYHRAHVLLARAFFHGSRGDWPQAADVIGEALELAGHAALQAYTLPWYAEALMFSAKLDEAQAALDRAEASPMQGHDFAVHVLLMRAAIAHRLGEHDKALALLGEALARGPAPMWQTWACVDAAWLHAEAGRPTDAADLLAQIDATLAGLPVVVAAQARVSHAAGDVHGALTLHRQYVALRKEPGWNPYFSELGHHYEQQARSSGIRPLPQAPFLPSRSC